LTPKEPYSGRTAPLTSKHCILYIYSTNTDTGYFKHGIHSPFFPLQNAVCFIILTYLVPGLLTCYIQSVLKFKKNNSGAKRLILTIYGSIMYYRSHLTNLSLLGENRSWNSGLGRCDLCYITSCCNVIYSFLGNSPASEF